MTTHDVFWHIDGEPQGQVLDGKVALNVQDGRLEFMAVLEDGLALGQTWQSCRLDLRFYCPGQPAPAWTWTFALADVTVLELSTPPGFNETPHAFIQAKFRVPQNHEHHNRHTF